MTFLPDTNACISLLWQKQPALDTHDLQIASIAAEHDLTLVTHNVREFSRVPGLNFEDWDK